MSKGGVQVVEAMKSFAAGQSTVAPGERLLAWRGAGGWTVIFNGAAVPVPEGTVGEIDSAAVKQAAEERKSAREEEYQLAPPS